MAGPNLVRLGVSWHGGGAQIAFIADLGGLIPRSPGTMQPASVLTTSLEKEPRGWPGSISNSIDIS